MSNIHKELFEWLYIFSFILLLFAFFIAMMSGMIFDSPGSDKILINHIAFYGFIAYPFLVIFCIIKSKLLYNKALFNKAFYYILIPFLFLLIPLFAYFYWICKGGY